MAGRYPRSRTATGYGSLVPQPRPKRFEYTATVDRSGAIAAAGNEPTTLPAEVTPEHLVLAGLGRCTIASLDYHARRAGLHVAAEASASAEVTRRESDERYAFVRIDCALDVEIDAPPEPA